MKKIILLLLAVVISFPSYADCVQGYFRRDGTYVQGYCRSNPNSSVQDNYSYKGNLNPYSGEIGADHYRESKSSAYYDSLKTQSINKKSGLGDID